MNKLFGLFKCLAGIVHDVIVVEQIRNGDYRPVSLVVREKLLALGEKPELMAEELMVAVRDLFNGGSGQLMQLGSISPEEADHLYVELLAGACLGLYFLGVPMGHPWDQVLRWVERDGGGLPNGVCVAKAIGDLVRAERNASGPSELLIRTYLPVALFRDLVKHGAVLPKPPDGEDLSLRNASKDSGVLGRCYELLQIRLYAHGGRSISYVVPRSLIQKLLGVTTTSTLEDVRPQWEEMCNWMNYVFSKPDPACQWVCIIDRVGLPACFLNHDSGLFTFERFTDADDNRDFPLPASYMRSGRRKQYYAQLLKEREYAASQGNLLLPEKRPDILESLLNQPAV